MTRRQVAPAAPTPATVEAEIDTFVASCYADPLRWVRGAYPWLEPGPLEREPGPDDNQIEFLTSLGEEIRARKFDGETPVMPILMAETSGHGTGKSSMGGWLVDFILSTRPHCDLTVTAGTYTQLEARTWPAIKFWKKLSLTAPWFDVMEGGIYSKDYPDTWKCQIQTCKKQNAQAFAGQHAKRSTSGYILDEASEVPDEVWTTAYGGLTDGEPMMFAWGQPVRNTGEFYRVCFGNLAARWNHRRVDGRTSRFTNKDLIAQWIADYGIDSDFVKVRVLGLPPSASELQYIDKARVDAARKRVQRALPDDPLVAGFDVSGGGRAWNVIRFRRGLDGRVRDPIRLPGDADPDRSARVAICAELLTDRRPGYELAALFVDAAFGAPIVARLQALGHTNVFEVNFGGDSPDRHQLNMRAFMHAQMKQWLLLGSLPDEDRLCDQLCLAGYHLNQSGKLVIESKASIQARGEASPDDSDALCWVAGTEVRTPYGARRIEEIQVGDLVSTPMGARRVLVTHQSDTESLTTVTFSTGRTLQGKGAHRIYTKDAGFIRADALPLTRAVESDRRGDRLAWWLLTVSCIAAKSSGFKAVAATISPGTRPRRCDYYIGASGLTVMGLFLLAARSIISTAIGRITPSRIWGCAWPGLISLTTCGSGWPIPPPASERSRRWTVRNARPPRGTRVLRDWRGTARTASAHGAAASPAPPSACAVGSGSRPFSRPARAVAPAPAINAGATHGNAPSRGRVRAAVSRFWRTSIARFATVVTHVQTAAVPVTPTYNLTVDREHVYYANGVLVENCLTFAQAVAPAVVPPSRPPAPRSQWG